MARPHHSLTGKTAVVTGAAGGVGRALSRTLAQRGVKVAMADLDQAALDAAAAELGAETLPLALDVADPDAFTACVQEVEDRLGPLDILCNVAAIMPISRFDEERAAMSSRILDVNLAAVIHSTKEAARRMKARRSGHIVNVVSGAAWVAGGGVATYCASKSGVVGYSEAVCHELRGSGVEISVVAPTIIRTDMAAGLRKVRGVRTIEAQDVADTIVDVLERPRFAAFVPKSMGAMSLGFSALPYGLRHRITRLLDIDAVLLQADQAARRDYEARVARGAGAR